MRVMESKFSNIHTKKISNRGARARCAGAGSAFVYVSVLLENINRNLSGISGRARIETCPNSAGKPQEVAIVENIFHSYCLLRTTKPLLAFEQGGMLIVPHQHRVFFGPPFSHFLRQPRSFTDQFFTLGSSWDLFCRKSCLITKILNCKQHFSFLLNRDPSDRSGAQSWRYSIYRCLT